MASQGYTPGQGLPTPTNGTGARVELLFRRRPRPRYWLHVLLAFLTLLTTTAMGARMVENFRHNRPTFDIGRDIGAITAIWSDPAALPAGLPFSLPLMVILLSHELGHYLACRFYRVDSSLPYFLPSPTIIGTFGAFIRIRSPIYSKRVLFDVGIAGPLAGFLFLLPALAIGLAYSKVLPGINHQGGIEFGVPWLIRLMEKAIFPGVAASDIYLHPVARAAWVGVFSTGLNLLPIGQLDGGHILYSFVGERHVFLSKVFLAALVPVGLLSRNPLQWLLWAVVLLIVGTRHPPIFDPRAIGAGRRLLGWLALAIFVLCFMLAPIATTV